MQKRYNSSGQGIVFSSNFASNFFDANTIVIFDANTIPEPGKLYRFCIEFFAKPMQIRCKYSMQQRCFFRTNSDANTMQISMQIRFPGQTNYIVFASNILQNRCKYDANVRCKNDALAGQMAMQIRFKFRCKYDPLTWQIISFLHRIFMETRCKYDAKSIQIRDVELRCKYGAITLHFLQGPPPPDLPQYIIELRCEKDATPPHVLQEYSDRLDF